MENQPCRSIQLREMNPNDFPRCQWLREQVGWNQTLTDWQRFLDYDPQGCFVAVSDGIVVGTACTISYEDRFGWIAMVIVDPARQRQGIGKALLYAGFEHLERKGLAVKLDATPAGKLLYDTIGFVDEYGLARWETNEIVPHASPMPCESLTMRDLDDLDAYDAPIFGASRKQVLASYLHHYPELGFTFRDGQKIRGYILAREGTHAFHIGPWAAEDADTARALLDRMIHYRKPQRTFIDIIDPNPHSRSLLESYGFQQQRPFIRMFRGKNDFPGIPELIYGISGPELG
ncbi:MAG: N-acetyltransferase [Candidatus Omnitrophota bacterium]|nr:MAG: N-acetyltransferase [Candidatus Omnitrophota bacterium]